jgi:adenylate cyclase
LQLPQEHRISRKLAAIFAADVVGYSRAMETDEAGMLAALKNFREALLDPAIVSNNGRIFKLVGDGTLAEFGSVIDAVNCAIFVQREAGKFRSNIPIVLRIGINLGDVIVDGDDIYGDGVNVAARLEALASPGGICVSSIVQESVSGRTVIEFDDGGIINVKNIARPIRIWKWHPDASVAAIGQLHRPQGEQGNKISIAVLPFTNMSGDAEQDFFSEGISEDVIVDLSKLNELTVISRNSSFGFKGRAVDVRAIGRELGVGFLVEGSVRRAGNRVRITAQLTDAKTGANLWADRFDRDLSDLFAVQDEVSREIVQALKLTLDPKDKKRLGQGGTRNLDAYENFLKGRRLLLGRSLNRDILEQAKQYLRLAIELDPNYAQALALTGLAHMYDYQNRWTPNADKALDLAKENAVLSIQKDPSEPIGHALASFVATFERNFEEAISHAKTALALNPNLAEAYGSIGNVYNFQGRGDEAIAMLELALRLEPAYTEQYLHLLGVANFLAHKYETAAAIFRERIRLVPETDYSRAMLASALGHIGELDEAKRIWFELKEINPQYSFEGHIGRLPFADPADVGRIADGLKKAGISV